MATIELYKSKINNMSNYINQASGRYIRPHGQHR